MLVSQRVAHEYFYQGINYKPINTYSRACKAESLSNNSSPNPKHPACAQQPKSKARKPQQKRKIRSQFLIIIKTSLLLYSRYLCKRFHPAEPIHAFPPANSHIRSTPGTESTAKSTTSEQAQSTSNPGLKGDGCRIRFHTSSRPAVVSNCPSFSCVSSCRCPSKRIIVNTIASCSPNIKTPTRDGFLMSALYCSLPHEI
ncbi:hypothetical protein J3E69DRAFT_34187 [Trichoderma sp. SZMC 28015]